MEKNRSLWVQGKLNLSENNSTEKKNTSECCQHEEIIQTLNKRIHELNNKIQYLEQEDQKQKNQIQQLKKLIEHLQNGDSTSNRNHMYKIRSTSSMKNLHSVNSEIFISPPTNKLENDDKFIITIRSPNLTLKTNINVNSPISEILSKIKKKFPEETRDYGFFAKTGRNTFILLNNEQTISHYIHNKTLGVDPKTNEIIIDFQNIKQYDLKKNRATLKKYTQRNSTIPIYEQLFSFIQQRNVKEIEELFNAGVITKEDLEQYDETGQPPFHAAIRTNHPKIVELFIKYYDENSLDINTAIDKFGWTALHVAVSACTGNDSDDEILSMLLNIKNIATHISNKDLNTPLHYFVQKYVNPSCQQLGEILIKKAPEVINQKNKNGETPLHKAIFNTSVRVLMVKLLVSHSVDVNVPNSIGGETALHYACRLGRKDLVKILLHAGADINIRENRNHLTPYELALSCEQKEIAQILKDVKELMDFLQRHTLTDYFTSFLKEDLLLDILASVEESSIDNLIEQLKIEQIGAKLRFKKAFVELKDEYSKKEFENRIKKVSKTDFILPNTSNIQDIGALKQSLNQLSKELSKERKNSIPDNIDDSTSYWLIKHSEIEFTKELGTGMSGKVFKGLFKGQKVAIKVLKAVDSKTVKDFKKEFHVMNVVRSPSIVNFFGACLEPKICMVIEYCGRGSLYDILKKKDIFISWDRLFSWTTQLLVAVNCLHTWNPPVYHRDLKSLNILLNKKWEVKVCDFGLARFNTSENLTTMSKPCGTYAYLAPEIFYSHPFTEKSDIWSIGIILWEMSTRVVKGTYETPYSEFHLKMDFQIFYQVAEKGIRPTIPKETPTSWTSLIQECLKPTPEQRPSAQKLLELLQRAHEDYASNTSLWNSSSFDFLHQQNNNYYNIKSL